MPTITVAAVQMDVIPAPRDERLARAADCIAEAAAQGAQLIVLPELFNTGYAYDERLYERTESLYGETMQWMTAQAAEYGVHLAGTLLVVDYDDTYNAALLVAPDGQTWRYDKQYPYAWERAFYRDGHNTMTVADTALGKIGIMINWDAGHPTLWERYAARVDLLLVMNATPDVREAELHFPDGHVVATRELGDVTEWASTKFVQFLDDDLARQANWLGVPVVCAGSSGTMQTLLPAPLFSVGALVGLSPSHWRYINAEDTAATRLVMPMQSQTKILDADGIVITHTDDVGDTVVVQDVVVTDSPPMPNGTQPAMKTPRLAYPLIDGVAAALLSLTYRRGVRRQWGARMAPPDDSTVRWQWAVIAAALLAFVIGYVSRAD